MATELKVLHLSTHDYGGAGKAAVRIHSSLLNSNIKSKMLVKYKRSKIDSVFNIDIPALYLKVNKLIEVAKRRIQYRERYNMFSPADNSIGDIVSSIKELDFKPNVVILHWVANFISLNDIKLIKSAFNCNIYWYAMDMAPFTGGCHYAWDCKGYLKECSDCPAVFSYNPFDYPEQYFYKKKQLIEELKINAIASNQWVAEQIKTSSVPFNKIDICYLPIDAEVFKPLNNQKGSNYSEPIKLFFGVVNVDDERKGGKYFLLALEKLKILLDDSEVSLAKPVVILPGDKPSYIDKKIPFDIKRYPYAQTEKELNQLYQSADVFICTSIEDTGPMMVCESLMSGIPVIGFSMGICPELIENDKNGFVVENRNVDELAQAIFNFIKKDVNSLAAAKINARKSVVHSMDTKIYIETILRIISPANINEKLLV